ncbi:MAG TPA: hypothetical protein P5181_11920 [Dermatophilaceae bacterium]|nr:hypothetical protein [Dermatophilaceae bacterium]
MTDPQTADRPSGSAVRATRAMHWLAAGVVVACGVAAYQMIQAHGTLAVPLGWLVLTASIAGGIGARVTRGRGTQPVLWAALPLVVLLFGGLCLALIANLPAA